MEGAQDGDGGGRFRAGWRLRHPLHPTHNKLMSFVETDAVPDSNAMTPRDMAELGQHGGHGVAGRTAGTVPPAVDGEPHELFGVVVTDPGQVERVVVGQTPVGPLAPGGGVLELGAGGHSARLKVREKLS